MKNPQMLFEVSWEVCNMVGGIHTVLASKVHKMQEYYGNSYVTIGPDILRLNEANAVFREEVWDRDIFENLAKLETVGCRMGRWLIPGEPRCLLVNFGELHKNRNAILAEYWEKYQLHSLHGAWDYLEPVFFGHAAGIVIEHIYNKHLRPIGENTVAHCHEWLTGSGILYLNKAVPEIGTVFTTHATALGRSISAHHKNMDWSARYTDASLEQMASDLGVSAKHSMEAVAAKVTDCFTTVSSTTAEECVQLLHRKPDLVLPNALGDEFQNPEFASPTAVKQIRTRLLELAELTTRTHYDPDHTIMLLSSGRYEFGNKGVDVLLDSLKLLNDDLKADLKASALQNKKILVFLTFPAGHSGPKRSLLAAVRNKETPTGTFLCTHDLTDEANDPITQKLRSAGMLNQPEHPVHAVFIPIYLDGNDPLVPETYYQILAASDLSVFPSFYEPWGYTPMESIAYGVPTITSDLAGFGRWAVERGAWQETGIHVLSRKSVPFETAAQELTTRLKDFLSLSQTDRHALSKAALKTSQQARWKLWGKAYFKAHTTAMNKALGRTETQATAPGRLIPSREVLPVAPHAVDISSYLRSFTVLNRIPPELEPLRDISKNLWWSWNPDAVGLFTELGVELWSKCNHNPLSFLDQVNPAILEAAVNSKKFLSKLQKVHARFKALGTPTQKPSIGFFCAEYGLAACLKIYSGGLGILAGDLLKAASDMDVSLCAVGLAYHTGYFRQRINRDGNQEHHYDRNDFFSLPLKLVSDANGEAIIITVPFPSGPVYVRAWETRVGRIRLFLLDTDFHPNRTPERAITNTLYGGDLSHRLRQEFILGIGGFRLLKALGDPPMAYHMNEGHSSFLIMARLIELVHDKNLKYDEALEYVRHTSIFTTHTPVAAGHDQFPEDVIRPYLAPFEEALHKDWSTLFSLGQTQHLGTKPEFSMTSLALRGSIRINGVSQIHGKVSRQMFKDHFPGYHELEIPVRSVTNGVHIPTWLAPEWQDLFSKELSPSWSEHLSDQKFWGKLRQIDAKTIWHTHLKAKSRMINWLKTNVEEGARYRREDPAHLTLALNQLHEETLIIGFARRFAPYKRANLLLQDLKKLEELLSKGHPLVFLFAGKAHPSDGMGQSLIKRIIEVSRIPAFAGKIMFIENYDINVAQLLVSGCDVWLNTPTRPLEASGTSGMKAGINGVLNLSVPDGWWAEGFNGQNGWVIGDNATTNPPDYQNESDIAQIHLLLEHEIIPLFFSRSNTGIPDEWVKLMKESMLSLIPQFSSERMLGEYRDRFYTPALDNARTLSAKDFSKLYELCERKDRMTANWDSISFVDVQMDGMDKDKVTVDQPIKIKIDLGHPNLLADDLFVEAVLARTIPELGIQDLKTFKMSRTQNDDLTKTSTWQATVVPDQSGSHALGVRVVPRRFFDDRDFERYYNLVKWL